MEKTVIYVQYNIVFISPLQIQFSPLRQYAYVPAPKSQKIEGMSISRKWLHPVKGCGPLTDRCLPNRYGCVNWAEGEVHRAGRCPTASRQSSQ